MSHPGQRAQHLASLVVVAINRLLAHDDHIWRFLIDHPLEQLGNGQRLGPAFDLYVDAAVSTQRQGGANLLLTAALTDRYRNNLGNSTGLLQPDGLFNCNFTKWIDCHFDVIQVNVCAVRFRADFDVIIDHAFYRDQCSHGVSR